MDSIELELLFRMRMEGEAEEAKHNCKGCTKRVGIPCIIAKSCQNLKEILENENSTR